MVRVYMFPRAVPCGNETPKMGGHKSLFAMLNIASADDYPGKFVVRVAKSLHRRLAEAAAEDDVSLNQYVVTALASAVGMREKG
ncbi:MAG: toxin-antitoxin system HicB family antitoxin [Chloroflexi bacterium]|nr:toxin-antitoxin system HicB family antitoxin [Chloroflexota bacterium]